MAKIVAAMNMTLDGYCDHTAMMADEEIHEHYTELLRGTDIALYGRITYQLMEYWKSVVENPTGVKATDEFAAAMDDVKKIVYSRTLENVDWKDTELRRDIDQQEILKLKQQTGRDIVAGSPSMILQLSRLGLVDEYQLGLHPTVTGGGLQLFKNIPNRIDLKLTKTKTFGCGALMLYYEPTERPAA